MTESAPVARGRKRVALPDGMPHHMIRRRGLHEAIRDELRERIVAGKLPPGARIGEAALGAALGVSRTPLREALKLLEAEGLVEIMPHKGARVAPLDPVRIADLFEAAAGLEGQAAGLAAARASDGALEELVTLQAKMELAAQAGRRGDYSALNARIHVAIVTASRNRTIAHMHGDIFGRMERARRLALDAAGRFDQSVGEHRAILAALQRRDADAARALVHAHVLHTGEVLCRMLDPDDDNAAAARPETAG